MFKATNQLRLVNFAIAATTALVIGLAAERFDYRVREDFFAGFQGNQAALDRAMQASEQALASNPKHAEAMVWHGAGVLFRSGQAFQTGDFRKGQELWKSSLKEMETAVALEPDNLGVRIPRGAALIQASLGAPPEMAKPVLETAVSDFEKALEIQTPYFDSLGTHPRGELLQGLAGSWYRLGNQAKASGYYERIVKELPSTEYERRAKIWLETKSLPRDQMRCVGCHVAAAGSAPAASPAK